MKIKTSNIQRHLNKVSTQLIKDNPKLHYSFDNIPIADAKKLSDDMKKQFGMKKFDNKFLKLFQVVFMMENDRVGKRYGFTHNQMTDGHTLTKYGVSQKDQVLIGLMDVMLSFIASESNPLQYQQVEQQAKEIEICNMFGVSSLDELNFPVYM
jgi:hypothetical protein